jgi:hypothetical protein
MRIEALHHEPEHGFMSANGNREYVITGDSRMNSPAWEAASTYPYTILTITTDFIQSP